MEKISMSNEDYLEAIIMLGGTVDESVKSVDISQTTWSANPTTETSR